MSLQSVREIAAIHEIAEPWLNIKTYRQARDSGGLYPEGPYTFEAEIKVDPDAPLGAEFGSALAARNVQSHLLARAADALEALEAAGWKLAAEWVMEIAGNAQRMPDGTILHCRIAATIRFVVDRDRSDEEMAMDPDVVAARILGF